jgi:hypothetical protein
MSPSVALQNGKILVAGGYSCNGINQDMAIIRYNNDGSIDNNFGTAGKITTINNGDNMVYTMKVFGSRLYVAGSNNQFLLAAYQTYSTLPVSLHTYLKHYK